MFPVILIMSYYQSLRNKLPILLYAFPRISCKLNNSLLSHSQCVILLEFAKQITYIVICVCKNFLQIELQSPKSVCIRKASVVCYEQTTKYPIQVSKCHPIFMKTGYYLTFISSPILVMIESSILTKDYQNLSGRKGAQADHQTQAQLWLFYYCDVSKFQVS